MTVFVPRVGLTLPAALLLAAAAAGQTKDAPPESDQARARALSEAKLLFDEYVFAGERFPSCDFERPARVKDLIGPYSIKATFYDRALRPVETATRPGPYGAVLEVSSEAGKTLRRRAMLYRTAAPVEPGWHFDPAAPDDLARRLGVASAVVKRQADLIDRELHGRSFADLTRDPRAARLFTGLSLAKEETGAAHPDDDAFALERQWWVTLERRLQ